MSSQSRRKSISVIKELTERPHEFCFKQAVRLLERATAFEIREGKKKNLSNKAMTRYMLPASEFARFNSRLSFSFPSSEIDSVKRVSLETDISRWKIDVNFISLTGSTGILPYHYSETALQRLKLKDSSMIDFFNLFNHRIVSLFYQASCKYNFPIEYERKRLEAKNNNNITDNYTQTLLSLIGLGTAHLTNRLYTKDESIIYYAGLFTGKIRTISSLRQILQNHFSIPVEINDFIGQWQELISDVRTRFSGINNAAQNNCLGKSAMLGKKGWFVQGKIQIILGPLSKLQLNTFAPGTSTLKALDEIVRLYIGIEYDYDFIMRIKKRDIPERATLATQQSAILGWNTWLSSGSKKRIQTDETIDIPVSRGRFRQDLSS